MLYSVFDDRVEFEFDTIDTEYYLFLWILDMVHDYLVPTTRVEHLYYLTDVVLYAIAYNTPGIDLHTFRDTIWKIVCHYFYLPLAIEKMDQVSVRSSCMGDPDMNDTMLPFHRDIISKLMTGIQMKKSRYSPYYISDASCGNCQHIPAQRIVGLPELWDRYITPENLKHKNKRIHVDTRSITYKVYGVLNGQRILIHDIQYDYNEASHHTSLTLNDHRFIKPIHVPEIQHLYQSSTDFEPVALRMIAKHVKDLSYILYTFSQPEDISLFSQDRMMICISQYIFNYPIHQLIQNHTFLSSRLTDEMGERIDAAAFSS